jgi:hypothetical protein
MAISGDGGKGYGRRPQLAPNDQVEFNWEKIFGTKQPKKKFDPTDVDSYAQKNSDNEQSNNNK